MVIFVGVDRVDRTSGWLKPYSQLDNRCPTNRGTPVLTRNPPEFDFSTTALLQFVLHSRFPGQYSICS